MSIPEGESQEARIEWSVRTRHCAYCGEDLKGKKIVGSGSFKDGLFCSLDCFARFHGKKSFKSEKPSSDK
ncbi:hypothetical protein [Methylobacter sp. YRD-M1]|uniref:hypothetical protein n=1 Tax=Methylobacter sp. YRD-M1 TaxID=2911520 RepID=UPI003FA3510F